MRRLFFFGLFLLGVVFFSAPTAVLGAATCPTGFIENASGICFPTDTGLSDESVVVIVGGLMDWLLGIFGFIAIIAFVISGLQYLLAAGDEKTAETAKRNMQYSIIGIIVALSGYVIIQAVDNALNAMPDF